MHPLPSLLLAAMLATLPATSARAERTQVYSLRGADCGDCGREALAALKKLKGVKRATWDMNKVEVTTVVADDVTDDQVRKTIKSVSKEFHVLMGPEQGAYLPQPAYPAGT